MNLLMLLFVLVLAFMSHGHEAIAAPYVPPYTSKVAQITKHTDTGASLYSVDVLIRWETRTRKNLLLDVDAPIIWYDCIPQWNIHPGSCPSGSVCSSPASCEDYQCTDVRSSYSYLSPSCPRVSNASMPGWENWGCTCPVDVVNPITGSCVQPLLNFDELFMNTSDGRNTLPWFLETGFNGACADSSLLQSFPANVSGVMALSSSSYALPSLLYPNINILALCLPSSISNPGVLFVGSGPYYLFPQSDVDIRSLLSYAPLLKQPNSFGYFIGVKAILVNGKPVHVSLKNSTTKLSTVVPYTTLRTDVYIVLKDSFSNAMKRVPRVDPIQPFDMCFNTSTIGHTRVGLRVPHIALYLENGMKWTIFGANSIKQMSKDVACLGFVDGGMNTEHAIVIGTLQMEDNFLVFDLDNSTFGFSSSLLYRKTSCSNFNFTLA